MTFTLRLRGVRSGPITSEFYCDDHGRFETIVDRDPATGDAPDFHACPVCGCPSQWVISAPPGRVKFWEVVRGKADEKPHPMAMDTRDLADSLTPSEWKKKRQKMWNDHDYRQFKEGK